MEAHYTLVAVLSSAPLSSEEGGMEVVADDRCPGLYVREKDLQACPRAPALTLPALSLTRCAIELLYSKFWALL